MSEKVKGKKSAWRVLSPEENSKPVLAMTTTGPNYIKKDLIGAFTPDSQNVIRILPPRADDKDMTYWLKQFTAYYINGESFISPKIFNQNAPNPVANLYHRLLPNTKDVKTIKDLKGTNRVFLFVLNMLSQKKNKPMLWAAPPSLIRNICELCKDLESGAIIDPSHPETGQVVSFVKTGQRLSTEYKGVKFSKEYPLNDSSLYEMPLLRDVITLPTDELLESVVENFNVDVDYNADIEDESAVERVINRSNASKQKRFVDQTPDLKEDDVDEEEDRDEVGDDVETSNNTESETDGDVDDDDIADLESALKAKMAKLEKMRELKKKQEAEKGK